jgi:hypothetical protein
MIATTVADQAHQDPTAQRAATSSEVVYESFAGERRGVVT